MLRALITAGAIIAVVAFIAIGGPASSQTSVVDDQSGEGMQEFAPGAQGQIRPSIPTMLNDAEALAEAWQERLQIQEPQAYQPRVDLEELRLRALNHPRVRALLNADDGDANGGAADQPRYASNQVFLFASFSMPEPSLRAMMAEADALDVPVLFRGFVNNSVFDTQEKLLDVFGQDANIIGFSIDPTMFVRFGIETVPAIVITAEPVEPCETSGCANDLSPPHDIIRGNIPLLSALDLAARAGGEGAIAADDLRSQAGVKR